MSYFNGTIQGYVGQTPTLRSVNGKNGTPTSVTDISVAVDNSFKTGADGRPETTWYRPSIWGQDAETAVKFLTKGSFVTLDVTVEGLGTYQNNTTGAIVPQLNLRVRSGGMHFGPRLDGAGNGNGNGNGAPVQQPEPVAAPVVAAEVSIPF
jgi:single-stranded DNA-binding protein